MRTERLHLPCPGCRRGTVRIHRRRWAADTGAARQSVWADEPCACSWGCPVPPATLERLLRAVDAGVLPSAVQLPLQLAAAWAGQTARLCAPAEAA